MKKTILLLLTAFALSIGAAQATQQGTGAIAKWKSMDKCARQAQTAFPDFSPDFERETGRRAEKLLERQQPSAARAASAAAVSLSDGLEPQSTSVAFPPTLCHRWQTRQMHRRIRGSSVFYPGEKCELGAEIDLDARGNF